MENVLICEYFLSRRGNSIELNNIIYSNDYYMLSLKFLYINYGNFYWN